MSKIRRSFTPEDRYSIVQEAIRDGHAETCRQYNLSPSLLRKWRQNYLTKGKEGLDLLHLTGDGFQADLRANLKVTMKKRRVFDRTGGPESFKEMAVELSYAKDSVQEAGHELGIDSSRITKWRQSHKKPGQSATAATGLSDGQKQIRRLQKELKDAQLDRMAEATRYIKKGGQHLFQGRPHRRTGEIFRFIAEHANQFPVEKMCIILKVSSSGYYYWRKHPVGARQLKERQLLGDIRQVYVESQGRYGSPAPRWPGSPMSCGSGV